MTPSRWGGAGESSAVPLKIRAPGFAGNASAKPELASVPENFSSTPRPICKYRFRLTVTIKPCIFSIKKLALRATKQEASDIFSFIFVPERPLRWNAVQYVHYFLNHPKPDASGDICMF
jgi:hypothetical protein